MAEKDITLRDFILLIKEYTIEVFRKWWIVLLITAPILYYFVNKTYTTPGLYMAETKFLVESEGSSGGSSIGGLLGSLGIRKGGKSNPFKVLEVSMSKTMAHKIFFSKSECEDDYIANSIISKYELDKLWAESDPSYANFRFKSDNDSTFLDIDRKVFLRLVKFLYGTNNNREEALLRISLNEDSGVFKYFVKTEHECISLSTIFSAYENLRKIFEEELMANKAQTIKVLEIKRDSIKGLIDSKTMTIARLEDRNKGSISKEQNIQSEKLLIEVQGLMAAYKEIVTNYEMSDISFRDSQPLFKIIDKPYPPLGRVGEVLLFNIILGIFLGIFISTIFIVSRKFLMDILKGEN